MEGLASKLMLCLGRPVDRWLDEWMEDRGGGVIDNCAAANRQQRQRPLTRPLLDPSHLHKDGTLSGKGMRGRSEGKQG